MTLAELRKLARKKLGREAQVYVDEIDGPWAAYVSTYAESGPVVKCYWHTLKGARAMLAGALGALPDHEGNR